MLIGYGGRLNRIFFYTNDPIADTRGQRGIAFKVVYLLLSRV